MKKNVNMKVIGCKEDATQTKESAPLVDVKTYIILIFAETLVASSKITDATKQKVVMNKLMKSAKIFSNLNAIMIQI